MRLRDKHGRYITDLRVSITDRCNYRCVYCRTGNQGAQYSELPFSDYLRMVRLLVGLGIDKIRLTGGEPLVRRHIMALTERLSRHLGNGLEELTFTTNGSQLSKALQVGSEA